MKSRRVDMNATESQTLDPDELALCEAARQSALQSKPTFDNWMTIGRAIVALRTRAEGLKKGRASRTHVPAAYRAAGPRSGARQREHAAAARDHGSLARGPGVPED